MTTTEELLKQPYTLHIERDFASSPATIWRCWTEGDLLMQWYCPKPWRVTSATLDVEPGGHFDTVFEGPAGEKFDNRGEYLEVEQGHRLVFGSRENDSVPFEMTGFVDITENGKGGTRMIWGAAHPTEKAMQDHAEMGFEAGWNAAADQLDELARALEG
ncbi:SRPBCC domain-containing protein [Parvularcula sp. LCG005]|uniref:SRPBCC domain-containing protein n=1 Tax=Parvularcula sp. LCG005 TaxID=3078805 RepID=UPI00294313F6|nr:SRPBCC domain-containing protein [Parvularcula sp. LCG005]WOI53724.1 SRPBCC domain-containing protein [Parvularcula sp. LCG005]